LRKGGREGEERKEGGGRREGRRDLRIERYCKKNGQMEGSRVG